MGVNYSAFPPDIEAIDGLDPGFWTRMDDQLGFPHGYTRAAVLEQRNNAEADAGHAKGKDASSNHPDFTADERRAYEHYRDGYKKEDWDHLVAEQKAKGDTPPAPAAFDDDKVYINADGPKFEPPTDAKWGGGDNKKRELAVSTEALIWMADQVKFVASDDDKGYLKVAHGLLDPVDVRPGGFAVAQLLRVMIGNANTDGLRSDTMGLLNDTKLTLYEVEKNLRVLAAKYDNAEDFNNMTAEDLGELMDGAWGHSSDVSGHGGTDLSTKK